MLSLIENELATRTVDVMGVVRFIKQNIDVTQYINLDVEFVTDMILVEYSLAQN